MKVDYEIKQINNSNIQTIASLANEAKKDGFQFVQRAIDELIGKANCFSGNGEILWGVFDDGKCIAIGGLNIDPYAGDLNTGRVRHLYVSPNYRRKGIATFLLNMIIERAREYFNILRLSAFGSGAANPIASKFYEEMGFLHKEGLKQTHMLDLRVLIK